MSLNYFDKLVPEGLRRVSQDADRIWSDTLVCSAALTFDCHPESAMQGTPRRISLLRGQDGGAGVRYAFLPLKEECLMDLSVDDLTRPALSMSERGGAITVELHPDRGDRRRLHRPPARTYVRAGAPGAQIPGPRLCETTQLDVRASIAVDPWEAQQPGQARPRQLTEVLITVMLQPTGNVRLRMRSSHAWRTSADDHRSTSIRDMLAASEALGVTDLGGLDFWAPAVIHRFKITRKPETVAADKAAAANDAGTPKFKSLCLFQLETCSDGGGDFRDAGVLLLELPSRQQDAATFKPVPAAWHYGIDVGTSNSCIAQRNQDGVRDEILPLPPRGKCFVSNISLEASQLSLLLPGTDHPADAWKLFNGDTPGPAARYFPSRIYNTIDLFAAGTVRQPTERAVILPLTARFFTQHRPPNIDKSWPQTQEAYGLIPGLLLAAQNPGARAGLFGSIKAEFKGQAGGAQDYQDYVRQMVECAYVEAYLRNHRLDTVTVTYPAWFSNLQQQELTAITGEFFPTQHRVIDESLAAAHGRSRTPVNASTVEVIVDVGGGSVDLAVVEVPAGDGAPGAGGSIRPRFCDSVPFAGNFMRDVFLSCCNQTRGDGLADVNLRTLHADQTFQTALSQLALANAVNVGLRDSYFDRLRSTPDDSHRGLADYVWLLMANRPAPPAQSPLEQWHDNLDRHCHRDNPRSITRMLDALAWLLRELCRYAMHLGLKCDAGSMQGGLSIIFTGNGSLTFSAILEPTGIVTALGRVLKEELDHLLTAKGVSHLPNLTIVLGHDAGAAAATKAGTSKGAAKWGSLNANGNAQQPAGMSRVWVAQDYNFRSAQEVDRAFPRIWPELFGNGGKNWMKGDVFNADAVFRNHFFTEQAELGTRFEQAVANAQSPQHCEGNHAPQFLLWQALLSTLKTPRGTWQ